MIRIQPYNPASAADRQLWDTLVNKSKNATFLLLRNYMDYHADRFTDASLIITRRNRPVALFAASSAGNTVTAHGGLTYGGFVLPFSGFDGAEMLEAAELTAAHFRQLGFNRLIYKPIPHIYHRNPADEDLYALFRLGAVQTGCGLSSSICLNLPAGFNENSRRNLNRAIKSGITVRADNRLDEFHALLEEVLTKRHNTHAVHSLDELTLLASRFPDNIRLYSARNPQGKMIAGSIVYFTPMVAHLQYIASSTEGRESGALAAVCAHIAENCCAGLSYLDFGISTENQGRVLNEGLLRQKYGFGGRGVIYPTLELNL